MGDAVCSSMRRCVSSNPKSFSPDIRLSLGGVLSVLSPDIQLSLGESAGFSADIRLSLAENFRECASPGDN